VSDLFDHDTPNYDGANFPTPRPFQDTAHEALRQGVRDGHRCQILMAPTGAGKTYLGLRVSHEALRKQRRALFMCDRITLINQTSNVADGYGLSAHGIIQADHWRYAPSMPFQIASAQTLVRRAWPDRLNVVIIDECHTQLAAWVDYIKQWQDKPITEGPLFIGLSATPFSRGLGKLFTNLVNAATMHELTESGVLVPLRVFSCTPTNMKGAATAGGEWTDKAAEERGLEIVGDVVTEWVRYGADRKTIVFGATINHCEEICRQFNQAGIMAAVFCATTSTGDRERLLAEYRKPDSLLRVLVSVEALAKGFDVPDVGCVVDCRPLRKSLSTFIQMIGRGLRASTDTGKTDCILLDHSGNIVRFLDDFTDIFYNGLKTLDSGEKLDAAVRKDDEEREQRECPKCHFKPFSKRCICCGFEKTSTALVEHQPGEMREVMIGKQKAAENQIHLWEQIVTYNRGHGNAATVYGRSCHTFKDITGDFPPKHYSVGNTPDVPVTKPVLNKIRSRFIAWAKTRRAA
jgi:DNA repair protein RadD